MGPTQTLGGTAQMEKEHVARGDYVGGGEPWD